MKAQSTVKKPIASGSNRISREGKIAILFSMLLNLMAGIQYCWSLLGRQLITDLGWSAVQATRPYSFLTLTSSLWPIVAGRWGDNVKPRYPIMFGGLMLGLGLILSSMHQSPWLMVITAGVLLGLSSSSISCNTAGSAIKWAPYTKKGMVAGLVTAVFAIGAIYMTPLINVLLSNVGRKGTLIYLGLAGLILIPGLALFQPQPDKKRFDNEGKTGGNDAVVDLSKYKNTITPNQALKTKEFYVCGILYMCGAMSGQVFVSQAAMIAGVQAPSWGGATSLVIVIAVANAIGRFFWSSLGDKLGPFNTTKFMMGIQCVNMLLFRYYSGPFMLIIGCAVLGFCFGGIVPMLWGWLTTIYGQKYCSSLQGMVSPVWGISGIIGPMIAATFMDSTGTYTSAYYMLAVVSFIGFCTCFTIKDKPLFSGKTADSTAAATA